MACVLRTILCFLATFSLASSMKLTKEIETSQFEPQSARQAFVDALKGVNIREELLKLLFVNSPSQLIGSLENYLSGSNQPSIPEIIDIFNAGAGFNLLQINNSFLQVNSDAFEKMLSGNAKRLAKSVYPNNYLQQVMLYGMLQKQISEVGQTVRPLVDEKKIPLQELSALLNFHSVSKRDVSDLQRADLLTTIELAVCESLISTAYSTLNSALEDIIDFLENIEVSDGDDVISSLVSAALKVGVEVAESFIDFTNDTVYSLTSTICSDILESNSTSRRRRDVDEENIGTQLEPLVLQQRAVATRNLLDTIFGLIWGLVSTYLNSILTSFASTLIVQFEVIADTFITTNLAGLLYGIIDSIFPTS